LQITLGMKERINAGCNLACQKIEHATI